MRNFWSLASLALLIACGAKTSRSPGDACLRDEDCGEANYCEFTSPLAEFPAGLEPRTSRGSPGEPVAPPLCDCNSDTDCPGAVCEKGVIRELLGVGWGTCEESWDGSPGIYTGSCTSACSEGSCPDGFACAESGHCEIITCSGLPAAPCPQNWDCEPAESDPPASLFLEHRKLSEQGCVPLACEISGHCADDLNWICQPERSTEGLSRDPHGCVPRTCLEGVECGAGYRCQESQIALDGLGCVLLRCNEAGGSVCSAPSECSPESPTADANGCIAPAGGSGGTGSTGGGGGTAGNGQMGICQAR